MQTMQAYMKALHQTRNHRLIWWKETRIQWAQRGTKLWNISPKTDKLWTMLESAPQPETSKETTRALSLGETQTVWSLVYLKIDQRHKAQTLASMWIVRWLSTTKEKVGFRISTCRSKTCSEAKVVILLAVVKLWEGSSKEEVGQCMTRSLGLQILMSLTILVELTRWRKFKSWPGRLWTNHQAVRKRQELVPGMQPVAKSTKDVASEKSYILAKMQGTQARGSIIGETAESRPSQHSISEMTILWATLTKVRFP